MITMKRLFLFLTLLLVLVVTAGAHTYALITGVSNYNDTTVNLYNTTKDAKEVAAIFNKQDATVTVLTSRNATPSNIRQKLEFIVRTAKAGDNIVFFFSGHGSTGSIIGYGPAKLNYAELIATLSKARTNRVFCFIDACLSGSVAPTRSEVYAWRQATGNKISFFMSSRADEYSFENQWVGNGYFTQALLKGLRGKADTNRDRSITAGELFSYIYSDVTRRTKSSQQPQHPQLIGPKSHYGVVITKW